MKRYTNLELSVCVNGQVKTKCVTKANVGEELDNILKHFFDAPKDYTCDWWSLHTIDRCHYRTKNARKTNQKTQYCVSSASDGSVPSNGFLEDCFTTAPFLGGYITE